MRWTRCARRLPACGPGVGQLASGRGRSRSPMSVSVPFVPDGSSLPVDPGRWKDRPGQSPPGQHHRPRGQHDRSPAQRGRSCGQHDRSRREPDHSPEQPDSRVSCGRRSREAEQIPGQPAAAGQVTLPRPAHGHDQRSLATAGSQQDHGRNRERPGPVRDDIVRRDRTAIPGERQRSVGHEVPADDERDLSLVGDRRGEREGRLDDGSSYGDVLRHRWLAVTLGRCTYRRASVSVGKCALLPMRRESCAEEGAGDTSPKTSRWRRRVARQAGRSRG